MKKMNLTLNRIKKAFKGQRLMKCKKCGHEWITKSERPIICCGYCHGYTPKEDGILIE